MAVHPDPKQVLIIGFGFGSTAFGTLQYDPDCVDFVELVEDERLTAKYFEEQNHGVLADKRFHFIVEDGRNFVLTTRKSYDVISLNAIHPSLGPTLYTHDFFKVCRTKLKPDGLICVLNQVREALSDE
jgi:spermidine synthase